MPSPELRQRPGNYLCGLASWHPEWMQRFATTKMFMLVYGLLGTIQAMSYMYFIVTLTTIEKRFKIPSQTTGIILSGNEISQILFSLILSYVGGQRNRPRWIAWGIVFCGLSCYILALPHFIFGPGTDALQLTKEYAMERMNADATAAFALDDANTTHSMPLVTGERLCGSAQVDHECSEVVSIVPLILIFISQFVLGIGNTLYYSLGQTYLDDNTKKTNTPLMLAVAMALRMIGPIVGFFLGFMSLNMFIDPSKTPLIDKKDTRWLGAWWFGWMILGTLMVLFSGLIGLFPKQLPKKHNNNKYNSHMPQVLRNEELQIDEGLPLGRGFSSNVALDTHPTGPPDFPKLKDFPKALLRLLRNRLLIFNITSAIFYILGAAGYMTFLTKYMEVQFHKNAQSATVVVGPVSIIGMVIGLIVSGLVISKKKPRPSKVLLWNVIVGLVYIVGQISYMFMYCPDSVTINDHGKLNLSQTCNANCACEGVPYSPICHEETETTYFSACHAGCNAWNSEDKLYSNCSCLGNLLTTTTTIITTVSTTTTTMNYTSDYDTTEVAETVIPRMINVLTANSTSASGIEAITTQAIVDRPSTSPTTTPSTSTSTSTTTTTTKVTVPITTTAAPTRESTVTSTTSTASTGADSTTTTTTTTTITTTTTTTSRTTTRKSEDLFDYDYDKNDEDYDDATTLSSLESESLLSRSRRSVEAFNENILKPGVCLKDCNRAFWTFAIASLIVNWFGSSGRIGNLLVNYRAVSTEDKSFAQGLSLMMVSLFALIPGPIIFGRIIDSTCLIWTKTCTGNGNCQLYDQTRFRYMVNLLACALTAIGVIFDTLVWYHGRSLDLYGEKETLRMDEIQRKYKPITPLLAKRQERS